MTATEPTGTTANSLEVTKTSKPKTTPRAADDGMVSVSASIPQALKELIDQRAEVEERTQAVVVRRALKAYMDGWKPEDDQ